MSTLMVCKCPRCGGIQSCDYDDRYVTVCTVCIESGLMMHTRLIPKVFIDPEDTGTIREQYLTWDEYNERLKSEQGAEAVGNGSTTEEQRT